MTIRAVIVEDSRLARVELKAQLEEYEDICVFGEADHAAAGKSLIEQQAPDVVFLDINMPGKSGFDMLMELDRVPHIIFTTAYDEYALRAFEQNTLDYLLKPVSPERLKLAIDRLRERLQADKEQYGEQSQFDENSKLFVKDGDSCWLVPLADIVLMEAVGNYTRLYFDDAKPMIYKSLSRVEEQLATERFFRANRQQMINLTFIQQVDLAVNGALELTLDNGHRVTLSRRQSQLFRQRYSL
ncbi:MAG: LytR/AlgR family response regulator transcription factor [Pseudomonadota bacterium]